MPTCASRRLLLVKVDGSVPMHADGAPVLLPGERDHSSFRCGMSTLRLRVTREPASIIELQSEGGPAS